MRNVTRTSKPNSLVNNEVKWTKELLQEMSRCSKTGIVVDEKFYNKYNKQDVKAALTQMYNNFCCYCESKVGVVSYINIEHRKPKKSKRGVPAIPYPELTYDWTNLHLSCTICNTNKSTKYDVVNPILDAVLDVSIDQHFQYDAGVEGIVWLPKTSKGATTADHTALNRDELVKARLPIFLNIFFALNDIKNHPTNPQNTVALNEIKKKTKGPYGSMVQFLIDSIIEA